VVRSDRIRLYILAIILGLIHILGEGSKGQSYSLASALKTSLDVPITLGFDIDRDFSGIGDYFEKYRINNPEVSHVYLMHNGKVSHYATKLSSRLGGGLYTKN